MTGTRNGGSTRVSCIKRRRRVSRSVEEAVDLLAKKDFVKRAKYVIQKTIAKLRSDGTNSKAVSSTKTIDEDAKSSESLLAELVRALIKRIDQGIRADAHDGKFLKTYSMFVLTCSIHEKGQILKHFVFVIRYYCMLRL